MDPTDEDFRKVGFSGEAVYWRRSSFALSIAAQVANVPVEKLPPTYHFSPNHLMLMWYENLGFYQALGYKVRDDDGRWWTPDRLKEAYGNG